MLEVWSKSSFTIKNILMSEIVYFIYVHPSNFLVWQNVIFVIDILRFDCILNCEGIEMYY